MAQIAADPGDGGRYSGGTDAGASFFEGGEQEGGRGCPWSCFDCCRVICGLLCCPPDPTPYYWCVVAAGYTPHCPVDGAPLTDGCWLAAVAMPMHPMSGGVKGVCPVLCDTMHRLSLSVCLSLRVSLSLSLMRVLSLFSLALSLYLTRSLTLSLYFTLSHRTEQIQKETIQICETPAHLKRAS